MTRTRRIFQAFPLALATILAVLAIADGPVGAAESRVSERRAAIFDSTLRAVLDDSTPTPQRVIIRVRPGSRAALRESLKAHGDLIVSEHDSLDALTVVVHGEDIAALADNDAILSVSRDHRVRSGTSGSADPPPAVLRSTLGVNDSQWTGRGVGVAVIDSGLEMSSDFSGRVTAFYDFTTGSIVARTPYDDYGHGTHVAGTIGGSGAQSSSRREYRGLAPYAKLVVLKVLDKDGAGYTSDVIRAIDFAVANRSRFDIHIINLSLGHSIFEPAATDPLVQAVERASQAGLIVVAAAGNLGMNPETGLTGYAGITSPGNAPSAITVGAVRTENTVSRSDDRIADYSSAGPTWYDGYVKPDLVSPGHNIVSTAAKQGTLYKTYPQLIDADRDYMRLSGTSMATAVTSGSVALLLEANRAANENHPPLRPNAVKAILQYTAVGIQDAGGIEYDPLRKGAGSINPKGAIDLARRIDTSKANGQWWLTTTPSHWTNIGNETLAWNQGIIWGNGIIWGSTTYYNEMSWGTGIIWGSSTTWSSGIIWGSNVVWTDSASWSQGIIWGSDYVGQDNGAGIIWGSSGPTAESTAWGDLSGNATAAGGQ